MRTQGIVFDLFGTLVESLSIRALRRVLALMAEALGDVPERFADRWIESFPRRAVDVASTTRQSISQLCRAADVAAPDDALDAATALWLDFMRGVLVPRPQAIGVLSRLKEAGCRLGLISDCSAEVPLLWPETPLAALFDAVVFSCREGAGKTSPEVFHVVCRRLDVSPGECLYVADGSNRELATAADLGMRAVLLRSPDEDPEDTFRAHPENWSGQAMAQLSEVLPLVGLDQ